jgi:peptidoglycan/LPS O-acetylase OafA/YrhL
MIMKKSSLYIPELDSLRFFAFLMVLIHHAGYSELVYSWLVLAKYGWIGVDLFLSLSAFLFTRLLYVEYQETGGIDIKNFYIRRAFRIWPLYIFFFALAIVLTIQKDGWSDSVSIRALGMLTFTDNFMAARWGYNNAVLYSPHLWTISYEEQIYLTLPWILFLFYRLKPGTTSLLLLALGLFGNFTRAFMIYHNVRHPDIWVLPFSHFDSVLGGIVIGLGTLDKFLKRIPAIFWLIFGIIALWLVTRLPNVSRIHWELMFTYPLVGLGTSLIIHSLTRGGVWTLSSLLQSKILTYLGKISYGLYVYHKLGIFLANQLTREIADPAQSIAYAATRLFFAFIITVFISIISFQVLEKPFLKLKERFAIVNSRPI